MGDTMLLGTPAKILFLDDSVERHLAFAKRYPDRPDVVQTASLVQAWQTIKGNAQSLDFVWLDHDLGAVLNQYTFADENLYTNVTVMPLVRWMCTEGCHLKRDTVIVIHSWNFPGAISMQSQLLAAGYTDVRLEPFEV